MSGEHRPSRGGKPARELLEQLWRERHSDETLRERYPHAGAAVIGPITERVRLYAELGEVDMHPQRGVEREPGQTSADLSDAARSLRAAHRTHGGWFIEGRGATS